MNRLIVLFLLFATVVLAKESTSYKLEFQTLDFSNSTQKEQGIRYGLGITHKADKHRFMFGYEKTATETFQPPLPKDLEVNKYAFKYLYNLQENLSLQANYITINDNLVKTDGGHVYGVGVTYKNIHFAQFFTNYKPFAIYQTDVSTSFKQSFGALKTKTTLLTKYLRLKDYKDNPLSKNARKFYFTQGVKLHASYKSYNAGFGAFFGKRVFSVMDNGMKVQHHGMEFEETYMAGFGKKINGFHIMLKYAYAKATELPKVNENVIVRNTTLSIQRKF